jgi:Ca2+/H+ antiporter
MLLVIGSVEILFGALAWSPTAVLISNLLAVIPLTTLLNFAIEELSDTGQTIVHC